MLQGSDLNADAYDSLYYPVFVGVTVCSLSLFAVACALQKRAFHMDVEDNDAQLAAENSKHLDMP